MRGAWVAHSIKHPTLDFGSGHDLMVHAMELHIKLSTVSGESELGFSLPLSLPLPGSHAHAFSPSLKINK